jgi:hypothetical protein
MTSTTRTEVEASKGEEIQVSIGRGDQEALFSLRSLLSFLFNVGLFCLTE